MRPLEEHDNIQVARLYSYFFFYKKKVKGSCLVVSKNFIYSEVENKLLEMLTIDCVPSVASFFYTMSYIHLFQKVKKFLFLQYSNLKEQI